MRDDSQGLFWHDAEKIKPPKVEKIKRTPPARTWEAPGYLPNLEEARAFAVPLMSDAELWQAYLARERFVYDVESFPNYFLVAFKSIKTGKVFYFEQTDSDSSQWQAPKLEWALRNLCVISFNGIGYDLPLLALALKGYSVEQLKEVTEAIILRDEKAKDILKGWKVKPIKADHIDLIEVAPLQASLKMYAGRVHCRRMQDLPFPPDTVLDEDQRAIVRLYCVNDLDNTICLYNELAEQIALREKLSIDYSVDVRSKSDAQIAEAIIIEELTRTVGRRPARREISEGQVFRYIVPKFLSYGTEIMQQVLAYIGSTDFTVGMDGSPVLPQSLYDASIKIGAATYRLGIGGLHSSEQNAAYHTDADFVLVDYDVASYYPAIILNQQLCPRQLGHYFLQVYQRIVDRRLAAKSAGDKMTSASLKITINGTFGKTGNPYSVMYAPEIMLQITLTGQLALLMLIERFELAGIRVVSANTDGVVLHCRRDMLAQADAIVKQWELETKFQTEKTFYLSLYSRDVNNYIALKTDRKCKVKGAFSEKGSALDSVLSKNPENLICADAIVALLSNGTPIEHTIRSCRDVRRFVTIRNVKGGGVKDGVYLGKAIRWYHALNCPGPIVYARSGNMVARTDGGRPLMDLPQELPADIDFDWYVNETVSMLQDIRYLPPPTKEPKK